MRRELSVNLAFAGTLQVCGREQTLLLYIDSVGGNGFLQKLHCCTHETGDSTEKRHAKT